MESVSVVSGLLRAQGWVGGVFHRLWLKGLLLLSTDDGCEARLPTGERSMAQEESKALLERHTGPQSPVVL